MILAVIQARMGSTRLPKKVLVDIEGKPMLRRIYDRLSFCKNVDKIAIATSNQDKDKIILDFAKENNIESYAGSENDIVDRMYQTALKFKAEAIVRITGDCPLADPHLIDEIVQKYKENKELDFISNVHPPTFPDGLDIELISFKALTKLWKATRGDTFNSEWFNNCIKENPDKFKTQNIEHKENLSALRWTVDYKEDLEFVESVYKSFEEEEIFYMEDILGLLEKNQGFTEKNKKFIRDLAYKKALEKRKKMNINKSKKYFAKAKELIPGQSQTLSKGPTQFVQGVSPAFLDRGEGCHVWDVDGNEFIDFILALGPITLGYNYERINKAIKNQLKKGISFSLPHKLEVELAEEIIRIIPCAEMVRFSKNGTDVTTAAVKIARTYTGREKIAYCGYHGGSSDWWGITTALNSGVPKILKNYIFEFKYNDIESIKKLFENHKDEIAAVIIEPITVTEPKEGFLEKVKELVHENKALLIFDEIVTGFRISLGGAQEYFNVIPDMATFGKGIANGMPLSLLVGKKEYMHECEKIFFSLTFGGETLSLAAALETIKEMKEKKVIEHMWKQGKKLKQGYNTLVKKYNLDKYTGCAGYPVHTIFNFKDNQQKDWLELKSLFLQETVKRGVLFNGVNNICLSTLDNDIEKALSAIEEAFKIMQKALDENNIEKYLEGETVKPVFRKV